METKNPIKVLFNFDEDGYITGYQSEFWDGKDWQATFDTSKAVEMDPDELNTVVFGATKYTGGKLVIDKDKQADLQNSQPKPEPTATELKEQYDQLQAALLELADLSLGAKK